MKLLRWILCFLVFLLAMPSEGGANEVFRDQQDLEAFMLSAPPEIRAASRLRSLAVGLGDIASLSGEFQQEKILDFLHEPIRSQGVFHFARPDYLRWEYLEPAYCGLEIKAGQASLWTGSANGPIPQPAERAAMARVAAEQIMVWMNLDPERILAANEVTVVRERPLVLNVVPKSPDLRKFLKSLEVEFSPDERTVRRVTLTEPDGRTVLTFSAVVSTSLRPRPPAGK